MIIVEEKDANPTNNWCCSHTLSNCGKKALGGEGSGKFAEKFRKEWQSVVNHPDEARDKAAVEFGSGVKTAGGVRFFNNFEQVEQVHNYGPENVMDTIIPLCVKKGYSNISLTNMTRDFGELPNGRTSLSMAMVEMTSISSWSKTFAEGCYTFEGDSCLILRAKYVFERMEKHIDNGFNTDGLDKAEDRAIPMMLAAEGHVKANVDSASTHLAHCGSIVAHLKSELKELQEIKKGQTETIFTWVVSMEDEMTLDEIRAANKDKSAVDSIEDEIVDKILRSKNKLMSRRLQRRQ